MPAEDAPQGGPPQAGQAPGGRDAIRRHFRFPLTLPVLCRAARGEAGTDPKFWFSRTVNLSAGGVALLLPEPLAPGTGAGVLLEVEGRVRWVGAAREEKGTSAFPHGCQFKSQKVGEQLAADLYIEQFLRRARGEAPS